MAATPFAMAPVILEAAPAIPPGRQREIWIKTHFFIHFLGSHFVFCQKSFTVLFINDLMSLSSFVITTTETAHLPTHPAGQLGKKNPNFKFSVQPHETFTGPKEKVGKDAADCKKCFLRSDIRETEQRIKYIFIAAELTHSSAHQSFHPKSHSFDKLLRSLDGSLGDHRWHRWDTHSWTWSLNVHLPLGSYLIRLVEECFNSFWQASDQPERISKHIQAEHQHIHLFNSLKCQRKGSASCQLLVLVSSAFYKLSYFMPREVKKLPLKALIWMTCCAMCHLLGIMSDDLPL